MWISSCRCLCSPLVLENTHTWWIPWPSEKEHAKTLDQVINDNHNEDNHDDDDHMQQPPAIPLHHTSTSILSQAAPDESSVGLLLVGKSTVSSGPADNVTNEGGRFEGTDDDLLTDWKEEYQWYDICHIMNIIRVN
jgi:hypothetical protein